MILWATWAVGVMVLPSSAKAGAANARATVGKSQPLWAVRQVGANAVIFVFDMA